MSTPHRRRKWPVVVVTVLAVVAVARCGHSSDDSSGSTSTPKASGSPKAGTTSAAPTPKDDQDPTRYGPQVVTYAKKAGVNPRLLMAILYVESYKPHDPELERAWQRIKKDSAFGIANMHKAAFDEAKQGRDFANRSWQDLPGNPRLAIEAAAWHLHDLAAQLSAQRSGGHTKDELLALGYNAGAGNMAAFARGAKPGPAAQSYLDRLHQNWDKAGEAVKHPG
ncbi:transglycosylase SLT domain-containing protein [Streptomyces sp. NPDC050610]|uniref:transglycosylase SLT domain-containing protein n=1 Tax=Streptomyces sp. NPDC050610 TaxID=3157097 RepID=UPI00343F6DCD